MGGRPAVILDLDGTFADTSGDLVAAANAALAGLGAGPESGPGSGPGSGGLLDPQRDAATAFQGGRALLRLGLERQGVLAGEALLAAVDAGYPRLLAAYEGAIDSHTVIYPGAAAAMAAIRADGFVTGICTNKPVALAELLLIRLGVRGLFDAVIGVGSLPERKPHPAPYLAAVLRAGGEVARSMLVGDTDTDRQTARAAGVPVALVTFGPEGAGIARLRPDALLDHFDDLPRLAARLLA